MHDLPTEWSALCALVLLPGLRHGIIGMVPESWVAPAWLEATG